MPSAVALMVRDLGQRAVRMAQRFMDARQASKTLSDDLTFHQPTDDTAVVYLPHYWAEYVHDGRDSITLPPGQYMIYFPDKRDDPRTSGGTRYPTRQSQAKARRLTRSEFRDFMRVNRDRAASGLPPIMVVANRVGGVPPIPFFEVGLKPLMIEARQELPGHLRVEIFRRKLGRQTNLGVGTAVIG